jgi:Heparinase II/III-like protein/Heparinase II/III N-terminus
VTAFDATSVRRASLRWYMNRLRAMDPVELPHRAVRAAGQLSSALERLLPARQPKAHPLLAPVVPWLPLGPQAGDLDATPYVQLAGAIAQGRIERLDGDVLDLGSPPVWHRLKGECSRPTAGRAGPAAGADALRLAMEVHRHGHLVALAQAWQLERRPQWRAAVFDHLQTWLDAHPAGRGTAWASALDVALRLLNWSLVWQLIGAHEDPEAVPPALRQRWLGSIYEHARFVRKHRSRHSSANNHLIGELVGLLAARTTWPLWHEVVRWGDAAWRELLVEAVRQVHADGVGCEQASWYQGFVFELLGAAVLMNRALGHADDDRLLRRLGAMARFAACLRNAAGHADHHGDADHAGALALGLPGEDPLTRVVSLAVGLGAAPELAALDAVPASPAVWLFPQRRALPASSAGARAAVGAARARVRSALPRAFEDGGYYQLGARFGEPDEVLMTVDAGPLGYLGIAAHGHADALSLRLSVRGVPILVDRGTYAYNHAPKLRHYFRGTAAHNTLCLDGHDQSEYGGPFLWLQKAASQVLAFDSGDAGGQLLAQHDGYSARRGAPVHQRRVAWHGAARRFEIEDSVISTARHRVELAWHFAPGTRVVVHGGAAYVEARGAHEPVCLRLRMQPVSGSPAREEDAWRLHEGEPDQMHGWHSPRLGVLVPAPSLIWSARSSGRTSFTTWIEIDPNEGVT